MKEVSHVDCHAIVDPNVTQLPDPVTHPKLFHLSRQKAREARAYMPSGVRGSMRIRRVRVIMAWDSGGKEANHVS